MEKGKEEKEYRVRQRGYSLPHSALEIIFLHESSSLGQIRYPPEFQLHRQTPSGRKYVEGKKKKKKE